MKKVAIVLIMVFVFSSQAYAEYKFADCSLTAISRPTAMFRASMVYSPSVMIILRQTRPRH
jgi:hypothetical protein